MFAQFPQHQLPPPPQQHGRLPKRIHRAPKEPHHRLPVITPEDTILKFHQLLSDGALTLHHDTFRSLFKACRVLSALEEGRQFHAQAVKRGVLCDVFVRRSLVRMYAKCLACYDAHKVLAECNVPDVVSQNDLIIGFINNGDLETARKIFDGMAERNVVSWSIMVDGYVRHGLMEIAQDLFDAMPERNQFSWNSLISGYLRCGNVEVARGIFDQMRPEWSVITWTAMISGYTQNGRFKEALDLYLEMQIAGVAPNKITLVSILPAVAQLGALSQGRWIHAYMDKMGMEADSILGSALVDMYSKCGCIVDAVGIFEKLKHKELSAWNSIILGLAAHGRGREALCFFSRMQKDSLRTPNDITFTGVLSACTHAGLVDEGQMIFDLFTNHYKIIPNIRHYGCMIDLLARAGLLKEALELVEKMPVEPNAVIWKTLLSACRIHKKVEVVDRVWRKIIELGPQDSGFYTLISNIFNESGRWDDAGKVRRKMNDLQVRKIAGCSWVEVDGVVHEFLMGRESFHAQSREIRCVLYEMENLIKLEVYNAEQ
ncbi:pentatricopeptide repeat-containing protein At5g48910 [Elaeis guineensis]|uniref:Pentatricopeptide repeat-containing protein At1g08070, chloroplastic n=1 Tax=Elaeis guineensis var. tenera TaxID=51953 RepID=A0A6I9QT63_ELAGV|nr:pentatricopeptide repeat-containing protein At1g08070, chloroplastic [Elaeis guineensis]